MPPPIGDIVLFRNRDGTDSPAIVTGAIGDMLALTVFPINHTPYPLTHVDHDDGPNPTAVSWRRRPGVHAGPRLIGLAGE